MLEVNSGTFAAEVLQSDKPVVVDFWGPRCAPCLALMPQVEKLEAACADKVKFVKVDASKNRRLCLDLKVLALPTYLFYKNGESVGKLAGGEIRIQDIEEQINKVAV
jgi:thioredoxin 1